MHNNDQNITTLITGASSGIGKELAKICASKGETLYLVSKNFEKLKQAKNEIETLFPQITIYINAKDLTLPNSAQEIYTDIQERNLVINHLVNNAGFGQFTNFTEHNIENIQQMIQLNITTLTVLSRLFLPQMLEQKNAKILNIASIAGSLPTPYASVYAATKSYVIQFTRSLAYEYNFTNDIKIRAVCPGLTKTNFFTIAKDKNSYYLPSIFHKYKYAAAEAKDVADYSYKVMTENNYFGKIIFTYGIANRIMVGFFSLFMKITPEKINSYLANKVTKFLNK